MADIVLLIVLNLFHFYIGIHYAQMIRQNKKEAGMQAAESEAAYEYYISEKAKQYLIVVAWLFFWLALNACFVILQLGNDFIRVIGMLAIAFTLVLELLFVTQRENVIKQYQEMNARMLGNQAEYYARQYRTVSDLQNLMRRQRHEQKNKELAILGLAQKGDCQGIIRFLEEETRRNSEIYGAVHTGNFTVDAVLNYELAVAEERQIKVMTEISIPEEMDINATILCGILGNALDNAIDASLHLEEKQRKMKILMKVEKHNLFLEVKNRFDGLVSYKNGRLLSRKADSKNHGIGISVMQEMLNRANGTLETLWDEEWFTLRVIVYHVI